MIEWMEGLNDEYAMKEMPVMPVLSVQPWARQHPVYQISSALTREN